MTSTFVNNLALNEMATGDQSGSWGTVTNLNLELIGEGLGFATEAPFNTDANKTTTVAPGASDPARAMYFKVTSTVSGGLTATRQLTIDPDTINRLMFIENATTGGESITIKQGSGSGAAVTIPNGDTKAVILSGSGSGSIVLDAFASLSVVDLDVDGTANLDAVDIDGAVQIDNTVSVGVNDTGYDVKFFGDTASAFMLWDASADDLILGGAAGLSVNSAALVTGVLTTTAATVFNGGFASNDGSTISTADNTTQLTLISTDTDDDFGPRLELYRNSANPAANDTLAEISFFGENDAGAKHLYARTFGVARAVGNGSESAQIFNRVLTAGTEKNYFTYGISSQGVAEFCINEDTQDIDFRVESDGNANMLFVDAGNDVVSIGTQSFDARVGQPFCITTGGGTDRGGMSISGYGPASSAGPIVDFNVSRNSNPGSHAIVVNGDALGTFIFRGDDGNEFVDAAAIEVNVDAVPNDDNMSGRIVFYTAPTGSGGLAERMRITSTGGVAIGAAALSRHSQTTKTLIVNSSSTGGDFALHVGRVTTGTEGQVCFTNGNGKVGSITTNGTATTYTTSSDHRLKENVDYTWDATTRLKQLKPARFNFIADADTTVDGFLAHEAATVVPEAVVGTHNETKTLTKVVLSSSNSVLAESIEQSDWTAGKSATTDMNGDTVAAIYPSNSTWAAEHVAPEMQGIDQAKIVPLLVKTIQELEARITALES